MNDLLMAEMSRELRFVASEGGDAGSDGGLLTVERSVCNSDRVLGWSTQSKLRSDSSSGRVTHVCNRD